MDFREVFFFVVGIIVGALTGTCICMTIQLCHQRSEEYTDSDYFEEDDSHGK